MNTFIALVEKTAGYFIAFLALITVAEAVVRYGSNSHIPDGFVIGQMMQGIAICWGIATTTYADRHITVDIVYAVGGGRMRRIFDVTAHTITLLFMMLFGAAISFKVFDILQAGEISTDLRIPLWTGYTLAALGIVAAVIMAVIRWCQAVVLGR